MTTEAPSFRRLQQPISIPKLPKSAFEVCQDETRKKRKLMAQQIFQSDAVFPKENPFTADSYVQQLAVMYNSDSD